MKLADCGSRLVLLARQPVGVIKRRPGTLAWWSLARKWPPYWSINDAALSIVGDLFEAGQEGGMSAVWGRVAQARAEAIQLGARIAEMEVEHEEAST